MHYTGLTIINKLIKMERAASVHTCNWPVLLMQLSIKKVNLSPQS